MYKSRGLFGARIRRKRIMIIIPLLILVVLHSSLALRSIHLNNSIVPNHPHIFYDPHKNSVGTTTKPSSNHYLEQPYVANGYIGARIPYLGQGFSYDNEMTLKRNNQLNENQPNIDRRDIINDPIIPSHNEGTSKVVKTPSGLENFVIDDSNLLNGWPLFNPRYAGAFIAGFYDSRPTLPATNFPELYRNGYELTIASVPQWTTLTLSANVSGISYTLDPAIDPALHGNISDYKQIMSFENGAVVTLFTWLDSIRLSFTVVAHSNLSMGLVTLDAKNIGEDDFVITVEDKLDFNTSHRCELHDFGSDNDGIYMRFRPHGVNLAGAVIYSSIKERKPIEKSLIPSENSQNSGRREQNEFDSEFPSSVSTSFPFSLPKNSKKTITKSVGIISSDLVGSRDYNQPLTTDEFNKLLQSAKVVALSPRPQESVPTSGISFPNDPTLDLAAKASLHHLRANTRPDAQGVTAATGVGGLSSDSYAGMVFWDSDLWMQQALLPFDPLRARSFVNYRLYTRDSARANVPAGYGGAVYPWTSGRFGNCTLSGPCLDYEYHINTAVAMSAMQVYLSGAGDEEYLQNVVYPLVIDAATFYADYLVNYDESIGKYTTHNMTDPDEYANHVDNAAYTNSGISLVMRWACALSHHLGHRPDSRFAAIAGTMEIPATNNVTLEYLGMDASVGIKQADVIMMTYPLGNEMIDREQALRNMHFYSQKQVSYGPAMTFPIFLIVANELANSGCSGQSYLHKAVIPFLRGPFAQFSEQNNDDFATNGGTHPAFPFLTAHGGFIQASLQGLTGLRYSYDELYGKIERVLVLDPVSIPCLGGQARFEGVQYMNQSLTMTIDNEVFRVEMGTGDPIRIRIGDRNPKAGIYTLASGGVLEFPVYDPEKTYPGSISECNDATFVALSEGVDGDVAMSMNDGDNSTRWEVREDLGEVLIDLKRRKKVHRVFINWGELPAKRVMIKADKSEETERRGEKDLNELKKRPSLNHDRAKRLVDYQEGYNNPHFTSDFPYIASVDVNISVPFDPTKHTQVRVPDLWNTTSIELEPIETQYLVLEVHGNHGLGARLYEVVVY